MNLPPEAIEELKKLLKNKCGRDGSQKEIESEARSLLNLMALSKGQTLKM